MKYKFLNKEYELIIWSSKYLPELKENDVISIWENKKSIDVQRTIRKDGNGLFFTWNRYKYYIDNYYRYTKEDIENKIKEKKLISDEFIQGILNYGIDKIMLKVPEKFYDCNYGSMDKLINSKITKYNLFEINENYKIATIDLKDNRKYYWYVSDLVSIIKDGIIEVVFK